MSRLRLAAVVALFSNVCSLRITLPVSLSGPSAASGTPMANAAIMFRDMYNLDGGVPVDGLGDVTADIEITDDGSAASNVSSIVSAAYAAGVRHFLGPFSTELTLAALRTLSNSSDAIAIATAASVTGMFLPYPNAFGVLHPTQGRLLGALQTLYKAGARTMLQILQPVAFAFDACGVDPTLFGFSRAQVTQLITYANVTTDAILSLISRTAPDMVIMCVFPGPARSLLAAAQAANVNTGAWVGVTLLNALGSATDPVLGESYLVDVSPWDASLDTIAPALPQDRNCLAWLKPSVCMTPPQFTAAYSARFGIPPVMEAAASFSGLSVLMQSVAAARSTAVADLLPIVSSRAFETVFGTVSFGSFSRQNSGTAIVRQALPGGVKLVAVSASGSSLVYPAPTWAKQTCVRNNVCANAGTCRSDGGCDCSFGYAGSTCTIAFGAPVIAVAAICACLLIVLLTVTLQRYRQQHLDRKREEGEKRAREALEAASRYVHSRTLTYAAHELANPLQTIFSSLDAVEAGDGTDMTAVARHLRGAAQRLKNVMEDMASTGGMDASRAEMPSWIRLLHLLRDVRHRSDSMHGIRLIVAPSVGIPEHVRVPPTMLYQALVNLFAQLRDAAPGMRAGALLVTLEVHAAGWRGNGSSSPNTTYSAPSHVTVPVDTLAASQTQVDAVKTPRAGAGIVTAGTVLHDRQDPQHGHVSSSRIMFPVGSSNPPLLNGAPAVGADAHLEDLTPPLSGWLVFHGHLLESEDAAKDMTAHVPLSARAVVLSAPAGASASFGMAATASASDAEHASLSRNDSRDGVAAVPATPPQTRKQHMPPFESVGAETHSTSGGSRTALDDPSDNFYGWLRFASVTGAPQVERLISFMGGVLTTNTDTTTCGRPSFTLRVPVAYTDAPVGGDNWHHSGQQVPKVATHTVAEGVDVTEVAVADAGGAAAEEQPPVFSPTAAETPLTLTSTARRPSSSTGDDAMLLRAFTRVHLPLSILVVEDEVVNARLVTRMVRGMGFHVDTLHDGADVISGRAGAPWPPAYCCILLDIIMPRSNGVEVCKRLLGEGYVGIIIAMTANTAEADVRAYNAAGFHGILGKPFNKADMRRALLMCAARRGEQRTQSHGDDSRHGVKQAVEPAPLASAVQS